MKSTAKIVEKLAKNLQTDYIMFDRSKKIQGARLPIV